MAAQASRKVRRPSLATSVRSARFKQAGVCSRGLSASSAAIVMRPGLPDLRHRAGTGHHQADLGDVGILRAVPAARVVRHT